MRCLFCGKLLKESITLKHNCVNGRFEWIFHVNDQTTVMSMAANWPVYAAGCTFQIRLILTIFYESYHQTKSTMENVNWLSFVIAVLIPLVMGFIWYHPKVFGKAWMESVGMTEEKAKEANMPLTFGLSLVLSALLAFFLINFTNAPAAQEGVYDTFKHGAFHGVFLGVVVVIPVMVTNGLFEQKSWKNMMINVAYWIVTMALMGGVLDSMNTWA